MNSAPNPFTRILRSRLFWLLVSMLLAAIGGYLIFGLGQAARQRQTTQIAIIATANIPAEGQPVAPFAAVDPSVMQALLNDNLITNPNQTSLLPASVPPIGIYLPQTDAAGPEFSLPASPLATPASVAPENASGLPVSSEAIGSVELKAYAGDGCAPAGLPVSGVLTQRFHAYHSGIDIGVPLGTPVYATHSGEVIFAGWSTYGYGYLVILQNGSFITYYAHLSNFNVQGGDQVGAGSLIAWSGSTGNSTGPHVHYETRIDDVPVDPLTFEDRGFGTC